VDAINSRHENTLFLPGVTLNSTIKATGNIGDLGRCDAVLSVAPAQHTDVLSDIMPRAQAAVLSGPSFAIDVAKGLPTAVTLACADEADGPKPSRPPHSAPITVMMSSAQKLAAR